LEADVGDILGWGSSRFGTLMDSGEFGWVLFEPGGIGVVEDGLSFAFAVG
jgi:hypothetical protein